MNPRSLRIGITHSVAFHRALAVGMLAVLFAGSVLGDEYLPAVGGSGGSQFRARCAEGELLTGVELRVGDDVEAIRPLCVTAYGPSEATAPRLTTGSGLITENRAGPLGLKVPVNVLEAGWHGGTGGGLTNLLCPGNQPVVNGIYVGAEGVDTIVVNNVHLFCGVAAATRASGELPSNRFDGPDHPNLYGGGLVFGPSGARTRRTTQRCPGGQVAVGIHGRSGIWLDALGLICGEAKVTPKAVVVDAPGSVRPVGRVKLPAGTSPSAPRPICDVARDARARNSPAAPGLEAQCAAQEAAKTEAALNALAAKGEAIARQDRVAAQLRNLQPDDPSRRGFHVGLAAAEGHTSPGPGKQRIHDQLKPAEQAGYAAAVSFSLTRNRKRIADLAAKGEAIANEDPLAVELRNRQPEGPARRGFDVGMAAAEGQTADGPGKQLIRGGLDPAEQDGFTTAVSFSVDRNRNADSAAKGAAIAEADPDVAAARASEADVLYRLGFDIASGIFGDPALGAHGNTATGPGSMKIRNELSASARRGFDAGVAFHLSRSYGK